MRRGTGPELASELANMREWHKAVFFLPTTMMMMMMVTMRLRWQEDEEGGVRRDQGVAPSKVNTLPGLSRKDKMEGWERREGRIATVRHGIGELGGKGKGVVVILVI